MKTREIIQKEANELCIKYKDTLTLGLGMGLGKSLIAINRIKEGNYKNILITGYRTTLKDNWVKELNKWIGVHYYTETYEGIVPIPLIGGGVIWISNIQTCYKWNRDQISFFDLIIADETHELFTEEYGKLFINANELNIPIIGLSGTPDYKNKKEFYDKYCPIRMEYYNVEGSITNKVNLFVYQYELTDNYKVVVKTKDKSWLKGELSQYNYLAEQYEKAKGLMYSVGASGDYLTQAFKWMKDKVATKQQREAGSKFYYAVTNRKNLLWNLESSKEIALQIKNKILGNDIYKPNINNKVLLFSKLTSQASKLSQYQIHSKTGKNIKESDTINKEVLDKFNKGEIREISSCKSLTTGISLVGCNYMIVESFDSSDITSNQIKGRGRRLGIDEIANMIVIVPTNSQVFNWFSEAFKDIEYKIINNINELSI